MSRKVDYTSRDFNALKSQLEKFGEQYFPNVFNDFNDFSPETMFIEMMAFIGDNLNFNLDENYRGNFLRYLDDSDIESAFRLAKDKGYKPQIVSIAVGEVQLSQLVPAVLNDSDKPDKSYAGTIGAGTLFSNFSESSSYELIETVYMSEYTSSEAVETGIGGATTYYRIYATGKVRSGTRKRKEIAVGDPEKNLEVLVDDNVSFVESVVDSDGNSWYEVSYLAQDTVFESFPTEGITEFSTYNEQTKNQIRVKRVPRRFVVDHKSDSKCYLQFGQGMDVTDNELHGLTTDDFLSTNDIGNFQLNNTFIVTNFLSNSSFGLKPSSTTLVVNYVMGSGQSENAKRNTIINIKSPNITFEDNVDSTVRNSFLVNNTDPVSGASFLNSVDFIKNNTIKSMSEQNRCVTSSDYTLRSKLLPTNFGHVSKVFAQSDENNSFINLYVLSEDSDGNLENSNKLTKNNIKNYLSQYKTAGHEINIRDAFIVNIGVSFEYITKNGFNQSDVGRQISKKVEEYFDKNKWEINQPILLDDLRDYMSRVEGIVSVSNVQLENKIDTDSGYSNVSYNVAKGGPNYGDALSVLYPPSDPAIFELRFPKKDIKSRAK